MSLKQLKKLEIDTRNAADIEKLIAELSEKYETKWTPDYEKPDIGTAIAKLYARCAQENIGKINEVLSRYHTEFVNMLDISLLPAKPASSIVVMEMLSDTVPGTAIPKGTKLLTQGESPDVFETDNSLYVTGSRIDTVFMTDGEKATIVPILGTFTKPEFPGEEPGEVTIEEMESFRLFGEYKGIQRNAVAFTHPSVFDAAKEDIFVRIEGNPSFVDDIEQGRYEFLYVSEENGPVPINMVRRVDDSGTFLLRKDSAEPTDTLIIRAKYPATSNVEVNEISFSSRGEKEYAEAVNSGANDFDVKRFLPFTDTLAIYEECYIGHNRYFSKAGARIEIEFDLAIEEHHINILGIEEETDLKIIKRRKTNANREIFANCFAQEISIEYFNGTGWKTLPLSSPMSNLFDTEKGRRVKLSFICPDDWEETTSGSYVGRAIRFQLLKSDNCFLRPATHHYPIIRDLRISYSFEKQYVAARKAFVWYGTDKVEITDKLKAGKRFPVFIKNPYEEDALYLGLTKKIENGPVSILFRLEDGLRFSGLRTRFEYLGYDGWRPMKAINYTRDFTRSGVLMFMPPSDMKKAVFEGNERYYIRVLRLHKEVEGENVLVLPRINDIVMNAVSVSNIETKPEVPVYIDEVTPNVRFSLGAENVLDATVWVNEMGKYSREIMMRMASEKPDAVELEYDSQGQIVSFFVKWSETDRLETSDDPRVYMIDRLKNELIFGDGLKTYIPRVTDDVALRFSVRCCSGQAGNVGVGEISEAANLLEYIGSISNPVKAYGGSDIESLENALERGAGILSSRNRLVSMGDFKRAIMAYSDSIDQVAGIVGETIDGKDDPSHITFILLMKDYMEGSFAFHRIIGGLKEELLAHSELTLTADTLSLSEPIFVDISVSIWVEVVSMDDSFEIQNGLRQCLEDYLNPVGQGKGRGWKIGTLPKKPQILMRLDVLKSRAIVRKSSIIAKYTDIKGTHEVDLADLKPTPFMIPRSGNHDVHIVY